MLRRLIYLIALAMAATQADALTLSSSDKELSRYITKYANVYKLDRATFSCVLFIESSYRVNVVSDTDDYGIGQINGKTVRGYQFERIRLLTDVAYSVRAAAQVLADFKIYFSSNEPTNWVARYNIGFQSLTERGIGAAYVAYNNKIRQCITNQQYL